MSTTDRILDAAATELSRRGYDGLRIEHVAKLARLNKALVYRHFGDKLGLYAETLRRELSKRTALLAKLPPSLSDMLVFWSRQQARDADFVRLIMQEGLRDDGKEPVEAAARREYYARQVEMLREMQRTGRLREDVDEQALFLALLVLTVAPVMLPQIMRLAMPEQDRYERWEDFLTQLGKVLAPAG
jgi:TetR/AcrR family transcriptional regulator